MTLYTADMLDTVKKVTQPKMKSIKPKHLQKLQEGSAAREVDVSEIGRALSRKLVDENGITSYKSILVIHDLLRSGHSRFTNYLSTCNNYFNVGNRRDDYSEYIKSHSRYLATRMFAFKKLRYDILRTSADEQSNRTSYPGVLNETLTKEEKETFQLVSILQELVDTNISFPYTDEDLTNILVLDGFKLLLLDLMKAYACMNECMMSILDAFFQLSLSAAQHALDAYTTFVAQSDMISARFNLAKRCVFDMNIPDCRIPPASLIDALHEYIDHFQKKDEDPKSEQLADSVRREQEQEFVHHQQKLSSFMDNHPFMVSSRNENSTIYPKPIGGQLQNDPFMNPYDERDIQALLGGVVSPQQASYGTLVMDSYPYVQNSRELFQTSQGQTLNLHQSFEPSIVPISQPKESTNIGHGLSHGYHESVLPKPSLNNPYTGSMATSTINRVPGGLASTIPHVSKKATTNPFDEQHTIRNDSEIVNMQLYTPSSRHYNPFAE